MKSSTFNKRFVLVLVVALIIHQSEASWLGWFLPGPRTPTSASRTFTPTTGINYRTFQYGRRRSISVPSRLNSLSNFGSHQSLFNNPFRNQLIKDAKLKRANMIRNGALAVGAGVITSGATAIGQAVLSKKAEPERKEDQTLGAIFDEMKQMKQYYDYDM